MSAEDLRQPLSDAEIDRLGALIAEVSEGRGMNVERLDGYLAAVLCTPSLLKLDEWLPPVFGGETMDDFAFASDPQAQDMLSALMRHRNLIADTLLKSLTDREVFHWPLLLEDEQGIARGNEWARGFLQGGSFDRLAWADLLGDEAHGGAVLPMFAFAHEHDPDPSMRPGPIDNDKRESLLMHVTVGLVKAYAYFAPARSRRRCRAFAHAPSTGRRPRWAATSPAPAAAGANKGIATVRSSRHLSAP